MLKKLLSLWKDKDFKQYMLYVLMHPLLATDIYSHYRLQPDYLNRYSIPTRAIEKKNILHLDLKQFISKRRTLKNKVNDRESQEKSELLAGDSFCFPAYFSLATRKIKLEGPRINREFWEQAMEDDEDVAALHRFIYLYQNLLLVTPDSQKMFFDFLEYIIQAWCDVHCNNSKDEFHPEIFHSYTVAERLANWSLCLAFTMPKNYYNEQIFFAMQRQADFLLKHVEYYGEYFTGNHLFNNGKALYIVGKFLGVDDYALAGKTIMEDRLPKLIHKDGVLREGSSHYQFLFYKWLMDLEDVAEQTGDIDFLEKIRTWLERMWRGISFFTVEDKGKYTIPYFGDTSPDYAPDKLLDMIVSDSLHKDYVNSKHSSLLNFGALNNQDESKEIVTLSGDYVRMHNNSFIIFGKVNHDMYPNNLTGHFHHDTGSIVAYYNNHCFLSDCGRIHYIMDREGIQGKNACSHTILTIEDFNPEINLKSFYCQSYIEKLASAKPYVTINGKIPSFTLHSMGESRINNVKSKERSCLLNENNFIIKDTIFGTGRKRINIYFHSLWNIVEETESIYFEKDGMRLSLQINLKNAKKRIYHGGQFVNQVVSYGKSVPINSLIYEAIVELPVEIETVFKELIV